MNELKLYPQAQVAELMGVSPKTLEAMRQRGDGPKYHKFGRRVLYSETGLSDYIAKRTYRSTSEY